MNPKYPVYIISKGRWESRLTSKTLEKINIPYHIVVEPQEYDKYASVIDPSKIYTLPFSNLGQGSIPARNWVWEHSISTGAERHWILDDNIYSFLRLNRNTRYYVTSGTIFNVAEKFVDRYKNVAMSGFNYDAFIKRRFNGPPFYANTRIYSCILIKNDLAHRWRGRYNEDTDLSLRFLIDGWCTILFNAFLCKKVETMTMKGGNTEELYKQDDEFDGRFEMSEDLRKQHPHLVKTVRKWGRWQHSVDYGWFKKNNKLILKPDVVIPHGINNYGMKLINP